jgi:hypothetical protein
MTRLKSSTCPWCRKKLDLVTAIVEKGSFKPGDKEPVAENGDATVCSGCAMMSMFDDTARGGLRFPTREEWVDLQGEKMMAALLTAMSMVEKNNQQTMRTIWHRPDWMT